MALRGKNFLQNSFEIVAKQTFSVTNFLNRGPSGETSKMLINLYQISVKTMNYYIGLNK